MTSHTCTFASSLAEAIYRPSGDQASASTLSVCPLKLACSAEFFPVAASHTCIDSDNKPLVEAINLLSGDQAIAGACKDCPRYVSMFFPVMASQICTVSSRLLEAIRCPSGDHARENILSE